MKNLQRTNLIIMTLDKVNFQLQEEQGFDWLKQYVTKICDIDFYRKSPSKNDIGENFWGSNRSKSPEECELGSPIDSITNVFNLGAIAFGLLGGEMDRSFSKWDADYGLYEVAIKAVEEDRNKRYSTVKEFYDTWMSVLNQ